ncbi:MAG TPA: L,D-transpeptidase [Rubricoccaceae bacterium]|jgi:hypothetical protein
MPTLRHALLLAALAAAPAARAQAAYDQTVVGSILNRPGGADAPVRYTRIVLADPSGNSVVARHALYEWAGEGDIELGRERLRLTELLGGGRAEDLRIGDSIVVPARPRDFDLGALAFAPYPAVWPGAAALGKVVVVDKTTQTWAAYDRGRLARWGPASTGKAETPTPVGRFTMNWRAMERESSEAPPGETWLMRYVMNIDAARGIHLHQYDAVLTGPPQGHGCIRLVTADAEWLWAWSDPARTVGGRAVPGTTVIVQGTEPPGAPVRFRDGPAGPERERVFLPANPAAVARGD